MSKKVSLACGICQSKNYRLTKTQDKRLILNKFCKKCGKYTEHKEEK